MLLAHLIEAVWREADTYGFVAPDGEMHFGDADQHHADMDVAGRGYWALTDAGWVAWVIDAKILYIRNDDYDMLSREQKRSMEKLARQKGLAIKCDVGKSTDVVFDQMKKQGLPV